MSSLTATAIPYQMPSISPQSYINHANGACVSTGLPIFQDTQAYEYYPTSQQYPQHPLALNHHRTDDSVPCNKFASALPPTKQVRRNSNAPMSAPSIPPMQVPQMLSDGSYRASMPEHSQEMHTEKEQKVGGVAAHLDYNMDEMVDFVSEMAQGMYDIFTSRICLADIDMARSVLHSKSLPGRALRKYVLQILSSTRLPSSTILLGLLYLSNRMVVLSQRGLYDQEDVDIYSMLVIALVLGSKFLDDNTFQNKSWSEVSNIPVKDLNRLEYQWLTDIKWNMHIDQQNPDGLQLWLQQWSEFKSRKGETSLASTLHQTCLDHQGHAQSQQHHRLPPLNTSLSYSQSGNSSYVNHNTPYSGAWNAPRPFEWASKRTPQDYSPPSAPETGPNTPDSQALFGYYVPRYQSLQPFKHPPTSQVLSSSGTPSEYYAPYPLGIGNSHANCYSCGSYSTYFEHTDTACA